MAFDRPPAVTTRLGKYELLREQAGSGTGSTWIARAADDPGEPAQLYTFLRLQRHVLKKVEAGEAFLVEARQAQHFRHPNALALLDLGTNDGEVFVASEYIAGESLASLIAAAGAPGLPPSVVIRIGLDILEAVAAAHAIEPPLVHGELGPQHVRVGMDGVAKIGGFAVARALAKVSSLGSKNHERLAYAAPERVKAMAAPLSSTTAVDPRADLFSMGVLLWELLSRQRLFMSKIEAAVIQKVLTAPIPALSSLSEVDVPADVDEALQKALERDPARRFQSANEMIMALEGAGPEWIASHQKVMALVEKLAASKPADRRSDGALEAKRMAPFDTPVGGAASAAGPPLPPVRPGTIRKPTLLGLTPVVSQGPAKPESAPDPSASPPSPEPNPANGEAKAAVPHQGSSAPMKPVAQPPPVVADDGNAGAGVAPAKAAERPAEAAKGAGSGQALPLPPAAAVAPTKPSAPIRPAKPATLPMGVRTQPYGTPAQAVSDVKTPEPKEVAPKPKEVPPPPPPPVVRTARPAPPTPKPVLKPTSSTAVTSSGDAAVSAVATFTARSFGSGKSPSTEPKVVIGSAPPPPPAQSLTPVPPPPSPSAPPPTPASLAAEPGKTGTSQPGSIPTGTTPSDGPSDSRRGRTATALDKLGPGSTLGRYEILMPVARGGMASVWGARLQGTRGFQKLVAIKTMLPDVSDDPDFESMFLDEAKVAARIRHPNVAEILDLGEQDDVLYLVMEWIEGENLSTLLKAARSHGGVPLSVALRIASQTCAGLHAAHELCDDAGNLVDLIHRDISPANVLVSITGFVKLVDFGVAKSKNRLHVTRAGGMVKGKTPYLSPEQLGQLPIDRRSDIFSFGALLYVLLTGLHPFRGETEAKTVENIALKEPVALRSIIPSIPIELEKVVFKALEKDPAKRFSTAAELQRAIDQVAVLIGTPTTDHDVAEFVRKAIGDLATKRAQELRSAIAVLDADVAKPESGRPPDAPVRPPTVELSRDLAAASADVMAAAPPRPPSAAPPRPPILDDDDDEIVFEEVRENQSLAFKPLVTSAAAMDFPFAGPSSPALAPVVEESTPPTTALDGALGEEASAIPPRRRSKLQLIVGGAVGACALIGVLAIVAGTKGSTKLSGSTVKQSSTGIPAVALAPAAPPATAALPATATPPAIAAPPATETPPATATAASPQELVQAPPPPDTAAPKGTETASAATSVPEPAIADTAGIAATATPPPRTTRTWVAPPRSTFKPLIKPPIKALPTTAPKSTTKPPPKKYNPTGI
jgi:serine/threonine protein kinase